MTERKYKEWIQSFKNRETYFYGGIYKINLSCLLELSEICI